MYPDWDKFSDRKKFKLELKQAFEEVLKQELAIKQNYIQKKKQKQINFI